MGLSAAWALTRAGWRVRLVEQDPVPNPRGSSVDDHRLIRHAYGAAQGYMRMVDPAYRAWDAAFADMGEAPYVETGVLALAAADDGWLAASRDAMRADGHALATLDGAAVAVHFPFLAAEGIGAAFLAPRGGVLLARQIVAGLAAWLAARGVVPQQAVARDIHPQAASLTLMDGTRLSADLLVVAAGPWGPRLVPGLAARVRPTRQVVVRLAPPPSLHRAWAAAPMLLDIGAEDGFYAVPPVAGTPLKIGDHRFAATEDPDGPRTVSAAEATAILELARGRIRDLDSYRMLSAAACWYDVEPAERFLLEPLGPAAWVMSGFSGHGFKFGALLGLGIAAATDPAIAPRLPAWAAGEAPIPFALPEPTA